MPLNIEPIPDRIAKNIRVSQEAVDMIDKLAKHFQTTQGRVLEALLLEYGPKIMKRSK
jgi:hypothetical protein